MIVVTLARYFDNNEHKELLRAGFLFSEKYYIQIIFICHQINIFVNFATFLSLLME